MARRTREEAEQTRQALLDSALRLFAEQGIGQTSLKQVAQQAGVTHGALYWHFRNRTDLVAALYQDARLPLDDLHLEQLQSASQNGLVALKDYLLSWIDLVLSDPHWRRVWRVFHLQSSDLPEIEALKPQLREEREEWLERLLQLLKKARKQKQIKGKPRNRKDTLANELCLMLAGLISSNLLLSEIAAAGPCNDQVISTYLKGLAK